MEHFSGYGPGIDFAYRSLRTKAESVPFRFMNPPQFFGLVCKKDDCPFPSVGGLRSKPDREMGIRFERATS